MLHFLSGHGMRCPYPAGTACPWPGDSCDVQLKRNGGSSPTVREGLPSMAPNKPLLTRGLLPRAFGSPPGHDMPCPYLPQRLHAVVSEKSDNCEGAKENYRRITANESRLQMPNGPPRFRNRIAE